jgi:N-acyl-L-homoserine lactone synthetase
METLQKEFYFKTVTTDQELKNCFRLRYQVYCNEKQWLSPAQFPDGLESDEYDSKAVHVIAMDEDFKLVGMMRILRDKDFEKLPYEHHPGMKGKKLNAPNVAEISRFIVTAKTNGLLVSRGIIRHVYQTSRKLGIDNWIFVCEPSLIRFLAKFKLYLDPICQPSKYYGGFTLAGRCDIGSNEEKWRREDRETLKFNQAESVIIRSEKALVV